MLLARASASLGVATGYRQLTPRRDPRSGEGARRYGGRFNPPGSFPVLYLCTTQACAAAELRRRAEQQKVAVETFLPRKLWEIQAILERVLDLTDQTILRTFDITGADLVRDDRTLTHEVGGAAHSDGLQAILTPSATGIDQVLAIFLDNLARSDLQPNLLRTWTTNSDLDADH